MKMRRLPKRVVFSLFIVFLMGVGTTFVFNQGNGEKSSTTDVSNIHISSPLNEGTDQYLLVLTTGDSASWFYTTDEYYYDGDSIQSGAIGNFQLSYVQTAITGPGSVQFNWKVASETGFDYLKFYIDYNLMNSISGFLDWQVLNYSIPSGNHILKWEYSKDGSNQYFSDCGWIDNIKWEGPCIPILHNESSLQEYLNDSVLNHYYQTDVLSASDYHCIWLQAAPSSNDFNLYLYADNVYSSLETFSTRGMGYLDWVLLRPSSSQSYYPKAERHLGAGYASIGLRSGAPLFVETPSFNALNYSNPIEIYEIYLSKFISYDFTLSMPRSGDYDLFLSSLSYGGYSNGSNYLRCSENIGNGINEIILNYKPDISDLYAVIVTWKNGDGTYSLMVDSPMAFSDDTTLYSNINVNSSYYYQTGNASSSYYHCVWLQPILTSLDFNLYLYSDCDYSTLLTSSTRGAGLLDWIVFRPSSSQAFYPKVVGYSGKGSAYLQWEDSSNLISVGTIYSGILTSSECIETYMMYLSKGFYYNISLDVPNGCDFDLYVYLLSLGAGTSSNGYYTGSTNTGVGVDESCCFSPRSSGYYAILVTWKSGSGSYYLKTSKVMGLSDDSARYDYYDNKSYYYYQTGTAYSNKYHCVWLQPANTSNDFNLYLYSDSTYTSLRASSTRGAGYLDWIIVYPSSTQVLYPKVERYSGSGYAYIQWEQSSTSISVGSSYSGIVSPSDAIKTYTIHLPRYITYNFTLEVPSTGDYDLYLYSLSQGNATNGNGYIRCSQANGLGVDENIFSYMPSVTGYFAVIVVWKSGDGYYNLKISNNVLSDDVARQDYYEANPCHYYQTGSASSSYYHCIWLQPTLSANDFNLYLYSDSAYSTLRASSTRGAGYLDWVIFRPSSTQVFYPKVERNSGSGYGYIQWEDSSSSLSVGTSYSGSGSLSDAIEIYMVSLSSSLEYDFVLDVPSTGDYDLYLYSLTAGAATTYNGAIKSSQITGVGADEVIANYTPSITDYFLVIVTWKSGNGYYSLKCDCNEILLTDISRYNYYNATRYYYYQTKSATASNYHCIWLQPTLSANDFDLYLYTDSTYSTLWASSTRGAGCLDWVIFRPYSTQVYYPKVDRDSGSGYGYIQWEDSLYLYSVGQTLSGNVSLSDVIEIYRFYLSSSRTYDFTLDVPSGGDYDLYLYSLSRDNATNGNSYIRCSQTNGIGVDEAILRYTPSISDYFLVVVIWKSGSGSYLLKCSTPPLLSDDVARYDYYDADSYYYYHTGTASSSYYHCIWLQPTLSANDFNLYLYSDSADSSLWASSTKGAGYLDWVIFRPSSTQVFYPKVERYSGSGYAYIQWEDSSSSLSVGTNYSGGVSSSEGIETYSVYLTSSGTYDFTLDVSSSGDCDLYLYVLSSGTATNSDGAIQSSQTNGIGADEVIPNYTPSITGYALLIVTWKSGSGSYSLKVSDRSLLSDDIARYELYNATSPSSSYYYQTGGDCAYRYNCVWLQPTSPSNDFNLYLYSDSGYSILQTSSTRGAGRLDWVVFRPVSSQAYPKVERYLGSGYAYLQWEDSSSIISIGATYSGIVSSSECIEMYMVYLSSGTSYQISLDVPNTGDYNLYLYRFSFGGAASYCSYIRCSEKLGNGTDEEILYYVPIISDYYAVVVTWNYGNGSYNLNVSNNLPYAPLLPNIFLILGVIIQCIFSVIMIIRNVKQKKKSSAFSNRVVSVK